MRILTPSSAELAGISRGKLHGPRFRRLFHGVYVDASVLPTLRVLVEAARTIVPDAPVTGITALRLKGATIGADSPICLATRARIARDGIVTVPVDRPSTTGVARLAHAFEDAGLGLVDEVVTMDELRRMGVLRPSDMRDLAEHRTTRWLLSINNSGSVRESRTRMMLHLAGLPDPHVQFRVLGSGGEFLGRVDFAWPDQRVILEYEGQHHLTNADQWESDIHRYEEMERLGWTVIRVTAAALRDPVKLVLRVEAALRAGGWRGRTPVLDAAWLAHVG